jgi:hypothetical protein
MGIGGLKANLHRHLRRFVPNPVRQKSGDPACDAAKTNVLTVSVGIDDLTEALDRRLREELLRVSENYLSSISNCLLAFQQTKKDESKLSRSPPPQDLNE